MRNRSKNPICPHCDATYDIDSNESYHLYSTDDIEELQCNNCEKEFFVQVHNTFTFETQIDIDDF